MLVYIALGMLAFVALVFVYLLDKRGEGRSEGFDNVPASYFVPTIVPGGDEASSRLSPGAALSPLSEKLLSVPAMPLEEAQGNWGQMTSEKCYRTDIGESLKKTRNYLQRTNNYPRQHPDDCSAPNHEFVGTFYTPFEGVGRNPSSGGDYPRSTQI